MFLRSRPQLTCYAPIDLKKADINIRDGYDNGTNTPTTTNIEPIAETSIALSNMDTAVPDPAVSTGVSVKFGSDTTEYSVTSRTLGSGTDEVQAVEIDDDVSGGTFTLSFGGYTTGTIARNASTAVVEAALEALTSIGLGNVAVTGAAPIWIVTFGADLGDSDVALITGDGSLLSGGSTVDVELAETVAGVDAVNEIQELEATTALTVGVYTITLLGETTQNISFDATAIEVEMALESLDGVAVGEASVVDSGTWPAINETLTVTFTGGLAGTDIAMMTIGSGGLTGVIAVTESVAGVAGVEAQPHAVALPPVLRIAPRPAPPVRHVEGGAEAVLVPGPVHVGEGLFVLQLDQRRGEVLVLPLADDPVDPRRLGAVVDRDLELEEGAFGDQVEHVRNSASPLTDTEPIKHDQRPVCYPSNVFRYARAASRMNRRKPGVLISFLSCT